MGLFAIACAPTYGEAEPAPGPSSSDIKEKLPTDPSTGKAKPPATTGGGVGGGTGSSDGGLGSAPKTPGISDDRDAASGSPLDGGACSKAPSTSGYDIHAPKAPAKGACSTSDIGYYEGLLAVKDQTFGGLQKALKARNEACATCVFSGYDDATWGPVVMLTDDTGFYNWGSCYANAPSGSASCAAPVQQWFSCLDDACGACTTESEYDACYAKATKDPAQCGSVAFDACGSNLEPLNAACDTIAKAIAYACGP